MLNVREATHKQILDNAEINNIIKILGLQYRKKYETPDDMKTLRYGKVMIMADQDQVRRCLVSYQIYSSVLLMFFVSVSAFFSLFTFHKV